LSADEIDAWLNSKGYSKNGLTGSIRDYYLGLHQEASQTIVARAAPPEIPRVEIAQAGSIQLRRDMNLLLFDRSMLLRNECPAPAIPVDFPLSDRR
jgi:hypothetical protein